MLHSLFRRATAALLCMLLCLPAGTLPASAATPLGTLHSEGMAYLDGEKAAPETVVYAGDRLRTEEGRAAISLPRGGNLVLDQHSQMAFDSSAGGILIGLERGQLALGASSPLPIRLSTGGVTLSLGETFPTLTEVASRSDGSLMLAVRRGEISVAGLRRDSVVVTAGHFLTIGPRLAPAQSQTVGTAAHGKMSLGEKLRTFRIGHLSHEASAAVLFVGLSAAVVAAVVVPISIREARLSPAAP